MTKEKRLERLEAKAQESAGQALNLCDIHGNKIDDVKVLKMPSEDWGDAIVNGLEMKIAPEISWGEIILATADIEAKTDDYELTEIPDNLIFIRKNGIASACEILWKHRK